MDLADADSCKGPGLLINSDKIWGLTIQLWTQIFGSHVSNHFKVDPNDSKESISCATAPLYQKGSLAHHCSIHASRQYVPSPGMHFVEAADN